MAKYEIKTSAADQKPAGDAEAEGRGDQVAGDSEGRGVEDAGGDGLVGEGGDCGGDADVCDDDAPVAVKVPDVSLYRDHFVQQIEELEEYFAAGGAATVELRHLLFSARKSRQAAESFLSR